MCYGRGQIETQAPPPSCTEFLTCFAARSTTVLGDRGIYLFIMGATLGLFLELVHVEIARAVTKKLTEWQHWPTSWEFDRQLVKNQFMLCWFNTYFWFLAVAFL